MELFASKLQAPVRGNSLVRQRLTRLFEGPESRRLMTVVAGAGYGKTTLIADALAGSEHPVIWYRLDPGDRDPDVFNAYLTRGMITAFPVLETDERFRSDLQGLTPGTQLAAAGAKFRSPDRYLSRLAAVLSKVAVSPSFLVLDDFHTVADSPDICRALEYLLEVLPQTVGVVLLSRREPPLKLSRLRAGGHLTEINETDLSFTAPEIQTFYTSDIPLTDADTGHILEKTGGWPASLVLLKYALKDSRGEAIKHRLAGFSGSQSHIFAYLEENFFDAQPGEVQTFMIQANLLAEVHAHRCDRIFGVKGSRERLAALVREHLLVFPDRENPDIYHFHHLLRDFLNVKEKQFFSESKIRELHRRIAADMATDLPFQAIEHSLLAADYETCARMMEANEMRFLLEGSILFLGRCFEKIPETILAERPGLLFLKAKLLSYHGKPDEAMAYLRTAILGIRDRGSDEDELKYTVDLGSLYYFTGHVREARDLMEQVRDKIDQNSTTFVIVFTYLIFLSSVLGEFGRAKAYLREAKSAAMTLPEFERRVALVLFRTSEAYYHYIRGDFRPAGEVNRKLLAAALDVGAESCLPLAYYQDAATRAMETDYTEGLAAADRGIRVCEDMALNDSKKGWIDLAGADNCIGLDKADEARSRIDNAAELFEASGNRWGLAHAWEASARLALTEGETDTARAFMGDAFDLIRGYGLGLTRAIFENTMARILIRDGKWDQALDHLEAALPLFSETIYYRFENHLLTARVLWETGRPGRAAHHLRKAMHISDTKGYSRLLEREAPLLHPLNELMNREGSAGQSQHGPEQLMVSLTGRFGIRKGDLELDLSQCSSTPALSILKYMAAHPGAGFIPREVLIETVWPEADLNKTAKRFNMAMSSLRRLLQPDLPSRAPSAYILRKKDTYCLAWADERIATDTGRFEALRASAAASGDPEEVQTIRIEAEQTLSGEFLAEDPYLEWADPVREQLRSWRLENLRAIADRYEAVGDHDNALATHREILEADRYDEAAYAALMRLYHTQGRIGRLSETWRQCKQAATALGVPENPELEALYLRLTRS